MAPAWSLVQGAVLTSLASTATQMHKLEVQVVGTLSVDATSRIDVTWQGIPGGPDDGQHHRGGAPRDSGRELRRTGCIRRWRDQSGLRRLRRPRRLGRRRSGSPRRRAGPDRRRRRSSSTANCWPTGNGAGVGGDGAGGGIYVAVATLSGGGPIRARGGHYGRRRRWPHRRLRRRFLRLQYQQHHRTRRVLRLRGAGTVYLRDTDNTTGTLIIDNGSASRLSSRRHAVGRSPARRRWRSPTPSWCADHKPKW